jgi:glutamine cyclotransferase
MFIIASCCSSFFGVAIIEALATDVSSTTAAASSRSSTTTTAASPPPQNNNNGHEEEILYKSRDYHLLSVHPHSTSSFTQGLTYHNGYLYEGTGLEYQSKIMAHDPLDDMKTMYSMDVVPGNMFGEGITHYYVDVEEEETTTGEVCQEEEGGDNNNMSCSNNEAGETKDVKQKVIVREERIIQLTWKNKVGFIYRIVNPPSKNNDNNDDGNNSSPPPPTLELIQKFTYETNTSEGWGITFIPQTNEFYVSDGSEYIHVWDANTLQEKRRMAVTLQRDDGSVVQLKYLNELEFVDFGAGAGGGAERGMENNNDEGGNGDVDNDQSCTNNNVESSMAKEDDKESSNKEGGAISSSMSILANVWYQDVLLRIDPITAKVTRVYDLSDIYPYEQRHRDGADCLNGISVTGGSGDGNEGIELYVTGKLWPNMYRIRLID